MTRKTKPNEERRLLKKKEFENYVDSIEGYELIGEYTTVNTPVKMKHKCGRIYDVRPSHFKTREQRCKKCCRKEDRKKGLENFLGNLGEEYNLLSKYENNKEKVLIEHIRCGESYYVTPGNFNYGKRCPNCKNNSIGELRVKSILEKRNIPFIQQYKFKDCKNKKQLPFDFYIPELNICIEYQGIQHYKVVDFFGEENFYKTKVNDNIKMEYCKNNKIKLITVPYWEKDIESLLVKQGMTNSLIS